MTNTDVGERFNPNVVAVDPAQLKRHEAGYEVVRELCGSWGISAESMAGAWSNLREDIKTDEERRSGIYLWDEVLKRNLPLGTPYVKSSKNVVITVEDELNRRFSELAGNPDVGVFVKKYGGLGGDFYTQRDRLKFLFSGGPENDKVRYKIEAGLRGLSEGHAQEIEVEEVVKDGTDINERREFGAVGPRYRAIMNKLKPVLIPELGSGGRNCVQTVGFWWLALHRKVDGKAGLLALRDEVFGEAEKVRSEMALRGRQNYWLDVSFIAKLSGIDDDAGGLGDLIPTLDVNMERINGGKRSDPRAIKMDSMLDSLTTSGTVKAQIAGGGEAEREYQGIPVVAVNIAGTSLVGVNMETGKRQSVSGGHEVLLIDWDRRVYVFLDPMVNEAVAVDRSIVDFGENLKEVVFDSGTTIDRDWLDLK